MCHTTDGTGLWGETAQGCPPTVSLDGRKSFDVAVIGAGYTGLSAALYLAQQGVSVCVLEACEIGHGGSGRNVGLVNAGLWLGYDEIIQKLGQTFGNALIETLEQAPSAVFKLIEENNISCQVMRKGTLNCAHSAQALRRLGDRAARRKALGSTVEILDAEETARRTGTNSYHGALFDHQAGTIQPLAYAHGMARAAITAGAEIYTDSPVNKIVKDGGIWCLETPNGRVLAAQVLIAVGAYGRGNDRTASMVRGGQQVPLYFFQCATEPLHEPIGGSILSGGEGAWDTNTIMTSFCRDQSGRLIVGSVGKLQGAGRIHQKWAMSQVRRLFPQLDSQVWTHRWFGRIGMTGDHLPRLLQPAQGILSLYGYNGRGIGPGTIFGREIARYFISGNSQDLTLAISEQHTEHFAVLRGLGYETGARLYHMVRSVC